MRNNNGAMKQPLEAVKKGAAPNSSGERLWSELPHDVLVHIFLMVNVLDRIVNVASVCHSWRTAVADPVFSSTLDMSKCRQHSTAIRSVRKRKAIMELAFVRGINLGLGRLTTLIFDPPFQVSDRHLSYAASRCPNVLELVLPYMVSPTTEALTAAFLRWTKLESLFVAFDTSGPGEVFAIAGQHCPNLSVLKICSCMLYGKVVEDIVKWMHEVRLLSVHSRYVMEDAANALFTLPNLEEVYVAIHKANFADRYFPAVVYDKTVLSKAERLRVYHVCYIEDMDTCVAAAMGRPPLNIPFDPALIN